MTNVPFILLTAFLMVILAAAVREFFRLKKTFFQVSQGNFAKNKSLWFLSRPVNFMISSLKEREGRLESECKGASPLTDPRRETAILNVLDDIGSIKKELESEKLKFGLVLENLGDAVVVLDPKGRIVYSNPQMENLFSGQNLKKGNDFSALLKEANPNIDISSRQEDVLKEAKIFETELVLYPGQAKELYLRTIMAPLRFPGSVIEGIVGVFHNVTEFRKLDRLKYDFIATVSHELRTPLTVIAETISLLKNKNVGGVLNPKKQECVDLAERNQKRLARLVDNVLDIVRMETGHLRVEISKVLIDPLLKNLVDSFKPIFAKKNVKLTLNVEKGLPPLAADEDRLAQVIANLLNNAYKYTNEGQVELSAGQKDSKVEICVKDSGMGISNTNLERIFMKFEQIPSKSNVKPPEKGTGLGLYIAKNLIEAHGGRIWAKSELGRGTSFYVNIPIFKGGK
ncbi:MAG: PAS domain-containing protein [Candidatus Saganbacteria bacterium]|nr:PAS domain-containing protein [Candidatus Saganbacteria bacterium]